MNRWSNRFVKVTLLLLAGCQSTPRTPHEAPAESVLPAGQDAGSPTATAASRASAPDVVVPDKAAQSYAEALRLLKAGKTADAESSFRQLATAYPQLSGPEINLGIVDAQAGRLAEAESAFKSALERNPESAVAASELGIVERRLGKFPEAEAAYSQAIAAQPDYAPAYLNLGVLYDLYLGEPKKALEQFEHYVQLAGDNKQVSGWMVELRKRVGAPAAAKKEPA